MSTVLIRHGACFEVKGLFEERYFSLQIDLRDDDDDDQTGRKTALADVRHLHAIIHRGQLRTKDIIRLMMTTRSCRSPCVQLIESKEENPWKDGDQVIGFRASSILIP
jgi:hypothetical protein